MQLNGNVLAEEATQATLAYDIDAAGDHLGNKEKDDTEVLEGTTQKRG